jgi:2-desacetyl-2-hydroxyethyl bacteriochlorophyllide A dehydrogenase
MKLKRINEMGSSGIKLQMKAVVYEKSSAPNILIVCDVEKPIPNDNEVLIKIVAVSINAADYRSMRMGIIPKRKIFGADIAGRVEAAGKKAEKFKVGDEVFGDLSGCGFGGFAEYVVAPESALALKPARVSFEDAAALPMAAVTALQALRDQGNIQPGQRVLICGAGGGVGTFAVQLAKYFGTEVTAVCSANNAELACSLGADYVIDYTKEDFAENGKHYDLVLAVNGNRPLSAYQRKLAPKGIYVLVGGALSQVVKTMVFGAFMSLGGKKMRFLAAKPDPKDLEFIIKLVEEGWVKPVIDRRYPLHQIAEAMRYLSQGHARGKVIISVVQA